MNTLMKKLVASATVLMCGTMMLAPGVGSAMTQDELQAQIDLLLAQLADLQEQLDGDEDVTPPAGGTIAGCEITSFDRNLKVGMTGSDVKCMQIVLNSDSDTVLGESGAGSPGNETSYFGPITKAGVVKFQEKYTEEVLSPYGLTTGTGFVGSTTRAQLNVILAAGGEEEEVKAPSEIDNAVECITAGYYWGPDGCYNGDGEEEEEEEEEEEGPAAEDIDNSGDCIDAGYYWGPDGCYSGTEAAEDTLKVALNANTPIARTVADNTYVLLGVWDFTANTGETLSSLKFKRKGVGAPADFTKLYLYDGDNRLTSGTTITSDTNIAEFNNLGLTFASTMTLSLWGDVTNAAGGTTHYFEISSADDIVTSASSVEGSFPIATNVVSLAAVTEGAITVNSGSTASNVSLGQQEAVVEKFNIQATTENANLLRVTMRQTGTADISQLTNFTLHYSATGEKIADGVVYGKYVVFSITDGFEIKDGNTRTFEIRANIGSGLNPGDRIDLEVHQGIDVYAVGGTYGYGLPTTDNQNGDNIQVEGGVVTFTDAGPNATDVKQSANDVVVLKGTIASEIAVTVQELDVVIVTSGALDPDDLTDIRIKNSDTGATLVGPVTPTANAAGADIKLDFDQNFAVDGTLNWEITLDVASTVTAGQDFYVSLATSGNAINGVAVVLPVIEDFEGNVVLAADIVPSTNIVGETMTVRAASLSVGLAPVPPSNTYVQGTKDVPVLGITLKAGDADAITVDQIVFNAYANGANNIEDIISALVLVDDASNPVSVKAVNVNTTGDLVTFSGLNKVIDAGNTVRWTLQGDLADSIAGARSIAFDIIGNAVDTDPDAATMTANVVAYDSDGNAVPVYDEDGTADAGDWENANTSLNDDKTGGAGLTAADLAADGDENDADVEIEIILAGSLTAALGANTPLTQIIDGESTDVYMTDVTFYAVDEVFTVSKMTVLTSVNSAMFLDITADYDGGSNTAYFSGNAATFTNMEIEVPANGETTVTFKVDMNVIELATSGSVVDIDWDVSASFEAISASGTKITNGATVSATDVAGKDHIARKTQLVISDTSADHVLAGGTETLMQFNASTASPSASMKKLVFDFTEVGTPQIDQFIFYKGGSNYNTSVTITNSTGVDIKAAGNLINTGDQIIVTFNTEEQVTSTGQDYKLVATASSVASGESVTVGFVNETAKIANNYAVYFFGELDARQGTNGEDRLYRDTAGSDSVWYDVNGNSTFNTAVDIVLGGTPIDAEAGTAVAANEICFVETTAGANGTAESVVYDPANGGVSGDEVLLAGDAILANDTELADALLKTVVNGTQILVWAGKDATEATANADATFTNGTDFEAGVAGGTIAAVSTALTGKTVYDFTNMHLIWSDRSANPHTVNSADFTNGNLLNAPTSDLSSQKNTLSAS